MKWQLSGSLGVAILLVAQTSARCDLIPITNSGFENPALRTAPLYGQAPIGWTVSPAGPRILEGGVWNINAAPSVLGTLFWTVGAPEGTQIGYLSSTVPALMEQTLNAVLEPDTTYTLTGEFGHPIGFGTTLAPPTVFTAELLAGSHLLASWSGTGPDGRFIPFQLTFDSVGSPFSGQALQIRFASSQPQTGFDAIALDGTADPHVASVPEPSTLTLFGVGAIAAFGWMRRRRPWPGPHPNGKPR
jgi:hypothetical protein